MTHTFLMKLESIQPSQLFISSEKLSTVREVFAPLGTDTLEPIPVKQLGNQVIFTDGHTRAFAAYEVGLSQLPVCWDEDDLDWQAYRICVHWCEEEGIRTIADLRDRVVGADEYRQLWLERCRRMHEWLEDLRRDDEQSP
jgi:hypothetical protein